MTGASATIYWIYEQVSNFRHTAHRPIIIRPATQRSRLSWRKPTIDDGTVSTLDIIRRSPAYVIR